MSSTRITHALLADSTALSDTLRATKMSKIMGEYTLNLDISHFLEFFNRFEKAAMDSSHGPKNTPVPSKGAQNHVAESLPEDVEFETSIK